MHFEYEYFFDTDEVFIRVKNMTELKKCFSRKSDASTRQTANTTIEVRLHKQKEEVEKKQEEEAQRMKEEEEILRKET